MTLTALEIDAVVEALRAGCAVTIGGSRCHTDYYFRDGAFRANDFDEGSTAESELSEQALRTVIARDSDSFLFTLDLDRWKRCHAFVLAGDWAAAAQALDGQRVRDSLRVAEVLRAIGAWPASAPSDELRAFIVERERSAVLYHVFMTSVQWEKSSAVSARAVEWLALVEAMIGAACEQTRRSFASDATHVQKTNG